MIESEDISIVVQGAINETETIKCLKNIRKYLPNAEVILSTWEGSDVKDLNGLYDILVLNKDPGFGYYYKTETKVKLNNLNRQLYSTQEGLKRATKKYAMKVRSDIILTNANFLKYFDLYPKRDKKYSLFKHKILTSTVFSRFVFNDYLNGNRFPEIKINFHVSDWWFFGLKEDLNLYFNIPLAVEPDFSNYYRQEENKEKLNPYLYLEESYIQFSPEQYFAIKCFEKHFNNVKILHAGDVSDENFELSRKFLINNFIFTEYEQSGIYAKKYLISKFAWLSSTYFDLYNRFRQNYEYKRYCDSNYKLVFFNNYICTNKRFNENIRYLYIHIHRICREKNCLSKFREFSFSIIFLLICLKEFVNNIISFSIINLKQKKEVDNEIH